MNEAVTKLFYFCTNNMNIKGQVMGKIAHVLQVDV